MKFVVIGCLCAGALAAVGCADGRGVPTSPSASAGGSGLAATAPGNVAPLVSASSPRSGDLHVTKECSAYTRLAGGFCTITSSNIEQIEIGTRVVYAVASGPTVLDSDVVLDPPGPGNNKAFGHCRLDLATGVGLCTFSGGTGKFTWFDARVDVSRVGAPILKTWAWDGTYSFIPRD
jgi:hypothetical protein